jgi:hypothetical protein
MRFGHLIAYFVGAVIRQQLQVVFELLKADPRDE